MKIKLVKNITQKIIISIILLIMLLAFFIPNYSYASVGGKLLDPICDFLCILGDGGNWILNEVVGEGGIPYINGSDAYDAINGIYQGSNSFEEYKDKLPSKTIMVGKEDYCDITASEKPQIPNIKVTPAEIFAGKVALLDADFFSTMSDAEYEANMLGGTKNSAARHLKTIIANWYNAFRLLAIVGLLSALVYIGIKIVISSGVSEKAEYKKTLANWLVALCLLFFLHYIMIFATIMVKEMQKIFYNDSQGKNNYTMFLTFTNENGDAWVINKDGHSDWVQLALGRSAWDNFWGGPTLFQFITGLFDDTKVALAFPVNLTGYLRVLASSPTAITKITYTVMYLAMTIYTFYFLFIYIKRVVILTFLTMIAPLVALTYPIDKLKDQKAQAFNFWLREYLVNTFLPLIHLILYTVLVTSAIDLVTSLPIYALCVLAFIVPAEKMVKSMFGIKSETAPALGGFAGGAIAANTMNKIAGAFGKKKGGDNKETAKDKIHYPNNETLTSGNKVKDAFKLGTGTNGTTTTNKSRNQQNSSKSTTPNSFKGTPTKLSTGNPLGTANIGSKGNSNKTKRKIRNNNILSNAVNMARRKYQIPKGKQGAKVLAKRAGIGLLKGGIRGAIGLTGAGIGLAGGIVGGDLDDMWKGMAGGAAAGGALGTLATRNTEANIDRRINQGRELLYGEEEADRIEATKSFMNNYDNIKYFEDKYPEMSSDQIQNELESTAKYQATGSTDIKELEAMHQIEEEQYDNYIEGSIDNEYKNLLNKNGITKVDKNNKDKAEQLKQQARQKISTDPQKMAEARELAIKQALEAGKFSQKVDKRIFYDDKKFKGFHDRLFNNVSKKAKDNNEAEAVTNQIINNIKRIQGIKGI